jgi:transglutaminase-like putative cysteine protease
MRFALAHKAATYLMVGCAYVAMAGGGGVAPMIALAGVIGLVGSWWWEPPLIRFERWAWVWTAASVLALAYSVVTAIATGDFLGVGGQFLLWLTVAKAYNRRAARDWQQLYLLSFLMLVAGSVLNADLTYGLCFLGYVVATTWAMTLFHLRREMEDNFLVKHAADRASEPVEVRRILDSRRIVDRRFFAGTGLLSLGVFLGAAIVFLALPRVGVGFFLKSRGGLTLAGFADGVKLGGHGVIKNDSTVVMRVEVEASIGGRGAPEIHWRGVAFDRYSHGQWSRSGRAPATRSTTGAGADGRDRRVLLWDKPMLSPDAVDALQAKAIRQEVWLEPLDSDVLFAAGTPRVLEYPATLRPRRPRVEFNDEARLERNGTIHYTAWSTQNNRSADQLRAARGPLPPGYQVYLQLPDEITPRTRALAAKITAGLSNDYDRAAAIARWLDDNLTYTLALADPGEQEPVDFFLFDRKQGHCEYFASGFAILARAVGIPTRSVNGFLGGEWNEYEGYVQVRAGDAHSWDEVYFPGAGWVTFDATPSGESELGRGGDGITARLGRFMDTLRFQWTKWVIEYDLVRQLSLFRTIGGAIKGAAGTARDGVVVIKRLAQRHWPIAVVLAGAVVLVVVWRRRHAPAALLAAGARRARAPLATLYDQAMKLLGRAGLAREPGITPRELADRLTTDGHPAHRPLAELTDLYYAATWGGRSSPAELARGQVLLEELRAALEAARRAALPR